MDKRKLTLNISFEYTLTPENSYDWETDEWLRGLVSAIAHTAGLQELIDNMDSKIKEGLEEHEWKAERLHSTYGIIIGDMKGKTIGKSKTKA